MAHEAFAVATDLSDPALKVAARNATLNGVDNRLTFLASDWFARVQGRFDLIVSNPPYIAADEMPSLAPEVLGFDPQMALTPVGTGWTHTARSRPGRWPIWTRAGGYWWKSGFGRAAPCPTFSRRQGLKTCGFTPTWMEGTG